MTNTIQEIQVNNQSELKELFDSRDFRISQAIVENILLNLNNNEQNIHVLSISVLETEEIFDISVERKYFKETLEENLPYYVKNEMYEECGEISKAIQKLS
jgi:hypothetical protein